jgi:hypothetical protein
LCSFSNLFFLRDNKDVLWIEVFYRGEPVKGIRWQYYKKLIEKKKKPLQDWGFPEYCGQYDRDRMDQHPAYPAMFFKLFYFKSSSGQEMG